jgi:hypothetical protein
VWCEVCDREASIMRRPWPTRGSRAMGDGGEEDVFYTKLLDVLPDYEPIMFEMCRSSIVLIQL